MGYTAAALVERTRRAIETDQPVLAATYFRRWEQVRQGEHDQRGRDLVRMHSERGNVPAALAANFRYFVTPGIMSMAEAFRSVVAAIGGAMPQIRAMGDAVRSDYALVPAGEPEDGEDGGEPEMVTCRNIVRPMRYVDPEPAEICGEEFPEGEECPRCGFEEGQ